jgi:hypothetical protein
MADVDLSKVSDEELQKIAGAGKSTSPDLSSMSEEELQRIASKAKPEISKTDLVDKASDLLSKMSRMIPLNDRVKEAGFIGRGVEAIENNIKLQDVPHVVAKGVSGALEGVPEFMANNPIASGFEQGAKMVNAVKDNSIFPKAATEEGEKLGRMSEIAGAFITALSPIKDQSSIAERITKSSVEKMKTARESMENATKKIVEFDSKVRGELFGARVKAGNAFDESMKALEKADPNGRVNLRPALEGLGIEIDEEGKVVGANPKLMADLKTVFKRSGNKVLENVMSNPDLAENLTLRESQEIIKSIKKIPSLAQKLNQGKFAQFSDTDIPVLQFIEDIRDSQLSAFPEFEKTLGAYRETMHKFRTVKPYFKESNLIKNITSNFQEKPVIKKFVSDLLPSNVVKDMDNVRSAIRALDATKAVAGKAAKVAAVSTLAGAGAGAGFQVMKHLF